MTSQGASPGARERYDQEVHPRCPSLGGTVPFRHCRTTNRGLPCPKTPSCWHRRPDLLRFLQEVYTPQELEQALRPAADRWTQLLEALEQATASKTPK